MNLEYKDKYLKYKKKYTELKKQTGGQGVLFFTKKLIKVADINDTTCKPYVGIVKPPGKTSLSYKYTNWQNCKYHQEMNKEFPEIMKNINAVLEKVKKMEPEELKKMEHEALKKMDKDLRDSVAAMEKKDWVPFKEKYTGYEKAITKKDEQYISEYLIETINKKSGEYNTVAGNIYTHLNTLFPEKKK
jgi:hypothetical protein